MSQKPHQLAPVVTEKRVIRVHDLIIKGKASNALKELSIHIKKEGKLSNSLMSLKAWAHLKNNNIGECEKVLAEIDAIFDKDFIDDEEALGFLELVYKDKRDHEDLIKHMKRVLQFRPNDKDTLDCMVNSYLAMCSWTDAKNTLLKVKKIYNDECYVLHLIVITALEAEGGAPDLRATRFMLAQKMLEKYLGDYKNPSRECIYFFMEMLCRQNKFQEGIAVMTKYWSNLLKFYGNEEIIMAKKIELAIRDKNWDQSMEFAEYALRKGLSNYCYYETFLQTFDQRKDEVYLKKLEGIIEETRNHDKDTRNILIALMETKSRDNGNCDESLTAIKNYIASFGSNPSAFHDIHKFVLKLDYERKNTLLDWILVFCNKYFSEPIGVAFYILYTECRCLIRPPCENTALEMKKVFNTHKTNDLINNKACQVAASEWLKLYDEDPKFEYLAEVIFILEAARKYSPKASFQRLILLSIYTQLGMLTESLKLFKELDIKKIQMVTASFVFINAFEHFGRFDECITLAAKITRDIDDCAYEAECSMVETFHTRAIDRIYEFKEFSHYYLANNIINCGFATQAAINSALFPMSDPAIVIDTLENGASQLRWDTMCDKRDFDIYSKILYSEPLSESDIAFSGEELRDFLRFKSALCGVAATYLRKEDLKQNTDILKAVVEKCRNKYPNKVAQIHAVPHKVECGVYVHHQLVQIVIDMLEGKVDYESIEFKVSPFATVDVMILRNTIREVGITTFYLQYMTLLFSETKLRPFLRSIFQTLNTRIGEIRASLNTNQTMFSTFKQEADFVDLQKRFPIQIKKEFIETIDEIEHTLCLKSKNIK